MSELIDKDAFVAELNDRIKEAHKWFSASPTEEIKIRAEQTIATFYEALLTAKDMPTIDAVSSVQCKECKWYHMWKEHGKSQGYGFCEKDGMKPHKDDWFCADWERREENAKR